MVPEQQGHRLRNHPPDINWQCKKKKIKDKIQLEFNLNKKVIQEKPKESQLTLKALNTHSEMSSSRQAVLDNGKQIWGKKEEEKYMIINTKKCEMIGWDRFPIQARSKEEYCYISVLVYTIKILHLLIKTTKNISISVSSLNELTEARNRLDQESKEQQVSITNDREGVVTSMTDFTTNNWKLFSANYNVLKSQHQQTVMIIVNSSCHSWMNSVQHKSHEIHWV